MTMADKTKKVFVRLVRDFPTGVTHRRGGVVLTTGPVPIEAEVTDEQLEALEGDANVEIVSKSEADKWAKYAESAPAHPSADELASEEADSKGRNYEGASDTASASSEGTEGSKSASSKNTGKEG
jgi:hypothetical protein